MANLPFKKVASPAPNSRACKVLREWGAQSAWVTPLMTYTWLPPTVGGQAFSEKCLHRCGRGDPAYTDLGFFWARSVYGQRPCPHPTNCRSWVQKTIREADIMEARRIPANVAKLPDLVGTA
jgi:hypothetical protein